MSSILWTEATASSERFVMTASLYKSHFTQQQFHSPCTCFQNSVAVPDCTTAASVLSDIRYWW